jgi:hypothetical protein
MFYSIDKIKDNGIGMACVTYGGEDRCIQGFCGETCGKVTTLGSRWEEYIKIDLQ